MPQPSTALSIPTDRRTDATANITKAHSLMVTVCILYSCVVNKQHFNMSYNMLIDDVSLCNLDHYLPTCGSKKINMHTYIYIEIQQTKEKAKKKQKSSWQEFISYHTKYYAKYASYVVLTRTCIK